MIDIGTIRISGIEAIDTLAFAKKLKSAGLPDAQAEAFAEAQAGMFRSMLDSTLATKDDLTHSEAALRTDLNRVETELRTEIAQVRTDMWRIVLGQTIALTGVIFAAAAFF